MALPQAIEQCLTSPRCPIRGAEREVLASILDAIPDELEAGMKLIFKSEKAHPGFFLVDGAVRVAKTGSHIGGPVYINLDLLYSEDDQGGWRSLLDVPAMVAILIYELGHHLGIQDHQYLDYIGAIVRNNMKGDTQLATLRPDLDFSILVVNGLSSNGSALWIIEDSENSLDITSQISSTIRCPKGNFELLDYRMSNRHWQRPETDFKQGLVFKPLRAWVRVHCGMRGGTVAVFDNTLRITFVLGAARGFARGFNDAKFLAVEAEAL